MIASGDAVRETGMLQAESAHPFQLKLQGIDAEALTLSNLVLQFKFCQTQHKQHIVGFEN